MFDLNCIEIGLKVDSQKALFNHMFNFLLAKNVVKESFLNAIIQREKSFPTGLQIHDIGLAIPHTDSIHVQHNQLYFATLTEPITFIQMGGDNTQSVEVKIVIGLLVNDVSNYVSLLSNLIEAIQDQSFIKSLLRATTKDEVKEIFRSKNI